MKKMPTSQERGSIMRIIATLLVGVAIVGAAAAWAQNGPSGRPQSQIPVAGGIRTAGSDVQIAQLNKTVSDLQASNKALQGKVEMLAAAVQSQQSLLAGQIKTFNLHTHHHRFVNEVGEKNILTYLETSGPAAYCSKPTGASGQFVCKYP